MDVNERVPLMNKIVTYSWAIIGIVIQVGFLMCKSYYLKKKTTVISAPVLLSQTSENDKISISYIPVLFVNQALRLIASAFCLQSC